MSPLETVLEELRKYEHPFFEFDAEPKGEQIELRIRSKILEVHSPEFRAAFSERDLNLHSGQFRWTLQRLLYGCLTDYITELFTQSPMTG